MEECREDEGSIEIRNSRALAALADMTGRQKTLASEPRVYGVVVELPEETVTDDESCSFSIGDRVRYVGAKHRRLYGEDGIVSSMPDEDGEVLVVFMKGATQKVGVGIDGAINPKREIAFHPDERLRAVIAVDGRSVNVRRPFGLEMEVGDTIALHRTTLQIVQVIGKRSLGDVAEVLRVSDGRCEVDIAGRSTKVVPVAPSVLPQIEERSRVLLDPSQSAIVAVLPSDDKLFVVDADTGVDWSDIKGQDEAVAYFIDAIERRAQDPTLFDFYNEQEALGALLKGPPGCGKTMIGRACHTALVRVHGDKARRAYLFIRGPEFLESLVGKAERRIRGVFAWARKFRRETGIRPILFFDEFDALGRRRGSGISSDATDSIVNTLLAEMDGIDRDHPFIIFATNRADMIDPALYREGRIDQEIEIRRPTAEISESIFAHYLAMKPLATDRTPEGLASLATQYLFDPSKVFYHLTVAETGGEKEKVIPVTFGHCVSGSLIAGIVKEAGRQARIDDQKAGTRNGIWLENLYAVISKKFDAAAARDMSDILVEVRATIQGPIKEIKRQIQARG